MHTLHQQEVQWGFKSCPVTQETGGEVSVCKTLSIEGTDVCVCVCVWGGGEL